MSNQSSHKQNMKYVHRIGEHMIRYAVAKAIGDEDEAEVHILLAGGEVECHACNLASSGEIPDKPLYLETYKEFLWFWDRGIEYGIENYEVEMCEECQNPEVDICHYHG